MSAEEIKDVFEEEGLTMNEKLTTAGIVDREREDNNTLEQAR
jgi:hypothetical protein